LEEAYLIQAEVEKLPAFANLGRHRMRGMLRRKNFIVGS